jgi:5-methylcytosine-specific restriction endonuclease McrA
MCGCGASEYELVYDACWECGKYRGLHDNPTAELVCFSCCSESEREWWSWYSRVKERLQTEWKPRILERDQWACRVCRSQDNLQLAHVTDAKDFCERLGNEELVAKSYRYDNLVTLCEECHRLQTGFSRDRTAPPGQGRQNALVLKLFSAMREKRGWNSAVEVLSGAAPDGRSLELL